MRCMILGILLIEEAITFLLPTTSRREICWFSGPSDMARRQCVTAYEMVETGLDQTMISSECGSIDILSTKGLDSFCKCYFILSRRARYWEVATKTALAAIPVRSSG